MTMLHNMSVPPQSSYHNEILPPGKMLYLDLARLIRTKLMGMPIKSGKVISESELYKKLKEYIKENEKWYERVKPLNKYVILYRDYLDLKAKEKCDIEFSDDIDLCLYILSKTVNGFYIPNKDIRISKQIFEGRYMICKSDFD